MPNKELCFRILPAQMIVKNFVDGCDYCNYELYLRDFINVSAFFTAKSHNAPYTPPTSEENKQCDCESDNYKLDFKLLLSETMGQGKREFSPSITQLCPGITFYGEPNITTTSPKYKEINATYLHVAFRTTDFEELCSIGEKLQKQHGYERDICLILKDSRKPKNILFMLPYEFFFKCDIQYKDGLSIIASALNKDLTSLIKYRKLKQPDFDTYFAFIYNGRFIILNSSNNELEIVDEIELTKSEIYQKLLQLSEH
ncbi:hypothetical protein [Ruminococcus sp.]|uniref:hypothetical protein n=1 Tax=Ruminococcus sp. TaxID=41978 RepID=UPI0025CC0692|nr:hypothetical protein [Ruminococcus sp.]